MSRELHELSVADAAALIAARTISPIELVDAVLERIDEFDPRLHSTITVLAEPAREAAVRADAEIRAHGVRGPLHGIPYGLKDNIDVAGVRTTANSRLLLGYTPCVSATVHERLEAAGAILVAKLATYEFGTGTGADGGDLFFPPARNPWNLDHFTGGSSTGCGAAVAAGMALFAIGADTGGSVRLPAAGCGLVGLKPSFGLVSRAGLLPNAASLDHVGPLTRTPHDAALVMSAIAGHDPRDATCIARVPPDYAAQIGGGVAGLRIGVTRSLDDPSISPEVCTAIEAAARIFARLGAQIVPVDLPHSRAAYIDCARVLNTSECFALHGRTWARHRRLIGPALWDKFANGACLSASDYLRACHLRDELNRGIAAAFDACDILLSAATASPAPRLADPAAVADFTSRSAMAPYSLSGHPALALPAGLSATGLPLSIQLASPHFHDAVLLRAAHAFEGQTRHGVLRPVIRAIAPAPVPALGAISPVAGPDELAIARATAGRVGLEDADEIELARLAAAYRRMTSHVRRLAPDPASAVEIAIGGAT